MSVRIVALLAVLAGLSLAPSNASAFGHLFGHRASGCDACGCAMAAPSCGCEIAAPTCGCEISSCDPCGGKKRHHGLFGRLRGHKAGNGCCDSYAPSCGCEMAAPTCGCEMAAPSCGCEMAAPSCGCAAAPSCGCEVSSCDPCGGKKRHGLFGRLRGHKAGNGCCDSYAPSCGCEVAAPSCGCGW